MTTIYFVRHAQPDYDWKDDITRPLTKKGLQDSKMVTEFLRNIKFIRIHFWNYNYHDYSKFLMK